MNNNSYLSEKEVEYIKWGIIYSDVTKENTKNQLNWYLQLSMKDSNDNISEEELIQYNRLKEFGIFVSIISGDERPGSVEEVVKRYQEGYYDEVERDLYVQMVLQQNFNSLEDFVNLNEIKDYMVNIEGQDLNEPFIQELIKNIYAESIEDQQYERMYQMIQSINFKYLSQNDKFMICFIIYKELEKPLPQYMKRSIRTIDKRLIIYLLQHLSLQFDLSDNDNKKPKK